MKRALAVAVLLAAAAGVWWAAGDYTPPDPTRCAALRQYTAQTPAVVYEMDRIGCDDPPYERLRDLDPTAQP